jgi:hypothetical protein
MGTHSGFDEKTLGTKENEKKPPSHTPTQKEKSSRHLECMHSFPQYFPQSFPLVTCNFSSQNYSSSLFFAWANGKCRILGTYFNDLNKSMDLWVSLPSTVNETIVYMGTLIFGFFQTLLGSQGSC